MSTPAIAMHDIEVSGTVAIVLAVAAALAIARVLWRQRGAGHAQRSRVWRIALLVLAQPLCAALLYLALYPPMVPGEAGTLVVATAGATPAQWRSTRGEAGVALPEAPVLPGVARVPDLATALRRHPGTRRIRVIGAGLEARDRDALHGLAVVFDPAPLPQGLVEFDAPLQVVAGGGFRVSGRVHGMPGGTVELLDPGRARVDRAAPDRDGRFTLAATARVPGAAMFEVRVLDASRRVTESIEVPVATVAPRAPRVLFLAGASGPEVKFLRRWARDAGVPMHTRIAAGDGMQVGDAPIALNAANLARFDVLVLDERAWSALGDAPRAAVVQALREGLGVLLRMTAAPSAAERQRLRALGFEVEGGRDTAPVRLAEPARDGDAVRARIGPGTRDAPGSQDTVAADATALNRRVLHIDARDGVALLRDAAGTALGRWRAEGRGRIAVWALADSYRLVLAGRGDLHGELWSAALATLARAQPRRDVAVEGEARVDQRIVLCGAERDAEAAGPDGATVPLHLDPRIGARACAAWWPHTAGWHRVQSGDRVQPVYVRAASAAPGLHANELREATLRLAARPKPAVEAWMGAAPRQPTARWPWWLAYLLANAALWWLERARAGRAR